jgi:D-amino-acid dehydrogenase
VTQRVVVVGAGIVGLCTAYSLRQRGAAVTVLEAESPGAGASSGNAGWLVPSVATPLPTPGLARTALRWMLGSSGPLSIRPRLDPALARWLWTFWRSCSPQAYARGLAATAELNREAVRRYDAMEADGVRFELYREGVIVLYLEETALEKDWRALEAMGMYGFARPHPWTGMRSGGSSRACRPPSGAGSGCVASA